MYGLDIQPAAGELAFREAWEVAPAVTMAVTAVRIDEYETAAGATRTRLAIAVEMCNASEAPVELAHEIGLLDDRGEFRRRVWVDPSKRPQALPGVCLLAPNAVASGEVYVPIDLAEEDDARTFIPSFGGLMEHDCQGCGRDHREFLPRAMWQPVVVRHVTSRSIRGW